MDVVIIPLRKSEEPKSISSEMTMILFGNLLCDNFENRTQRGKQC